MFRDQVNSLNEFDQASIEFNEQLQLLANFADDLRNGNPDVKPPDVLADQFETTMLERNQMSSAFLGERIRIARWRLSDKTPTFYDSIAVNRLFETLLDPWKTSTPFRIEFNIHTVNDRPNYFDAQVVVHIFGRVKNENADSDIGRSAIGVWQFIWQKPQNDTQKIRIKKINMIAHEETINYIETGKLFSDCTASVLRNSPDTIQALSFGLDKWAENIPSLNVIGDNGIAVGDFNSDGFDDIYVCQPHSMPNLLLRQNPDGTADEVALPAGVNLYDASKAALLVDLDNDGKQDLVVATDSRLVLFSNTGEGKFQLEHKLKISPGTESLSAADFDQDGDLDLFLAKYRPVAPFHDIFPQPNTNINAINGGRNILLRNDEAWKFSDVTSDVGIALNNQHYTHCGVWNDFDIDGDLDLYLANEFQQDVLYVNEDGWFTESYKSVLSRNAGNTTTSSIGDLDQDGRPDFFAGCNASFISQRITQNYLDNGGKLLRDANGYGASNRFVYATSNRSLDQYEFRPPIFSSESTYSSVVGDFNNDGMEDFACTNGWLSRQTQKGAEATLLRTIFNPAKDLDIISAREAFQTHHEVSDMCREGTSFNGYQRNTCFLTIGKKRFANFSNGSGLNFLDDARAIARTDWDGDGDLDLIINNRTSPRLRILKNQYASKNKYLKVRLKGTVSNRDAIGTRIELFLQGKSVPLVRLLTAGSGRKAQSSKEVHFGIGKSNRIDKLVVHWPSGGSQTFENLSANKTYLAIENQEAIAEFTNERYRIALDNKPIKKSQGKPANHRIRFFPTTRLPILQYRTPSEEQHQRWYQLENIESRPLLCIFCPSSKDNVDFLREWNTRERNIARINADLLVAFTGNDVDNDRELEQSRKQIEESSFQFRWGVLSESSNQKLAHCFGDWFFNRRLPRNVFGILLDGEGSVHFAYDAAELRWDVVEPDLTNLADQNFVLNKIPERNSEKWITNQLTPRLDRLIVRLRESGYDRDETHLAPWLKPIQSDDYMRRAIDLASKGNLVSALSAAERSVELNPDSSDAKINHAAIMVQNALSADQQSRTRLLLQAGELLDNVLLVDPQNEEAIRNRAEVFRHQNDIENALTLLTKYLEIAPDNWGVHAIVGRLYFHKREYLLATKYLINAIENRPKLPYVSGDLGYLYLINRQFQDAKEFLDLANRLQPSEINMRGHLAEAEFWLGNFERAGELYAATVAQQPKLTHAKRMFAWLKATSPFNEFRDGKEGLKMIEPFVEIRGDQSPSSLEIMAACFAEIGDFDEALAFQRRAINAIDQEQSLEKYSSNQLKALRDRLELYKRQRSYRIKDAADSPLQLLGGT